MHRCIDLITITDDMFIVLRKLRETVGDSRKLKVGFRETFSCCKGYTRLVLIFNLIRQFVSLARRLGFTSLAYCQNIIS